MLLHHSYDPSHSSLFLDHLESYFAVGVDFGYDAVSVTSVYLQGSLPFAVRQLVIHLHQEGGLRLRAYHQIARLEAASMCTSHPVHRFGFVHYFEWEQQKYIAHLHASKSHQKEFGEEFGADLFEGCIELWHIVGIVLVTAH